MKNLIKKILKESEDKLGWAKDVVNTPLPKVYRVVYTDPSSGEQWVDGYFTMESFKKYLERMNYERYGDEIEDYETEEDFDFEEVKINW